MNMQLSFTADRNEWAFGYCTQFAELGMASLVIAGIHVQFDCDADRDDLCAALGNPFTAFAAWLSEKFTGRFADAQAA